MSRVHSLYTHGLLCRSNSNLTAEPGVSAPHAGLGVSKLSALDAPSVGTLKKRERGSVSLLLVVMMMVTMIIMMYSVTVGQVYLAKDQLQISADAVARSALSLIKRGFTPFFARVVSRRIPRNIFALESGTAIPDSAITFGDWNFATNEFRAEGREYAAAVQVDLEFSARTPQGPLELVFTTTEPISGITLPRTLSVKSHGIAATGCREFVFVVDVSSSMQDELDRALALVDGFVNALDRRPLSGDKVGMVIYAGDAMSIDDYASDGGAFWGRPVPPSLNPIPAERANLDDWFFAMANESNIACVERRERMPTRGKGSCLGKGDQHGINRAIQIFEESTNSCSARGDRTIILITSDTPCFYLTGDGRHRRGSNGFSGGSFSQAYQAADDALAAGINLVPVLVDLGRTGNCPFEGKQILQHEDSPLVYIDKMARGFAFEGLVDPSQSELDAVIGRVTRLIPVRMVE